MLKISHSIENNNNANQVAAKQTEPYIIFTVDNEEIGVEAQKVLELVQYMPPLKMPNKFVNVDAMAIYRGRMIPIIDLRLIFGLEPIAYDDNTVTIIVESRVSAFGITAERVLDLIFIPLTSIKKVSALNFGEKTKYLKSVANFSERLVLLLDLDKMVETKPVQTAFEDPVQPESFIKSDSAYVDIEKGKEYLIDQKELEDLLNKGLSKPEQEKEEFSGKEITEPDPVIEIEQPNPFEGTELAEENQSLVHSMEPEAILLQLEGDKTLEDQLPNEVKPLPLEELQLETSYLGADSPKDGILKPEEIAEVLSNLESDGVMDLPEDLLKIETTVEIQMDPDQIEGQLSNEVIEEILKELESESEPNSKGQSFERDCKI